MITTLMFRCPRCKKRLKKGEAEVMEKLGVSMCVSCRAKLEARVA